MSKIVRKTIEDIGLEVIDHPPYSPDISPCDFWLFPELKKHLGGRHFDTRQDMGTAIYHYLNFIDREQYKKTFSKWVDWMKFCVDLEGEYFKQYLRFRGTCTFVITICTKYETS